MKMFMFFLGLWLGGAICKGVMFSRQVGALMWIAVPIDAALWPITIWWK